MIYVNQNTARITVQMPEKVFGEKFNISGMQLYISRIGTRKPVARYAAVNGDSGEADFIIDSALLNAKHGYYMGLIKDCGKPVKSFKIRLMRDNLGDVYTKDMTQYDDSCVMESCCKEEENVCGS